MRYPSFIASRGHAVRRFCLYAAGGRIYVQDDRSFLIDIGAYERSDDGFSYRIAGDAQRAGEGFAGADDVLGDLAASIDCNFLDIRFRTLPDHSEDYSLDLRRAAHRDLLLPVDAPTAEDGDDSAAPLGARARHASVSAR